MDNDSRQCDPCPWPLDCCTEDSAPKVEAASVDCPREHQLWERRLAQARLSLVSGVSMRELAVLEEEELDERELVEV